MNETYTRLTPEELYAFRKWGKQNKLYEGFDSPDSDYDMPGYWKAGASGAGMDTGSAQLHFPDTFKRPTHETFSVESKYSTPQRRGGMWVGDRFIPENPSGISLEYFKSLLRNYGKGK